MCPRPFTGLLLVLLLGSSALPLTLRAEWPEAYQKQVEADYEDIPLKRALEKLRDEGQLSMNIHPSLNLNQKVNLVVQQAPAREVIEMLCDQLDMAYTFQNGVILLTSKNKLEDIKKRDFVSRMVTKSYYIADLTGEVRDFRGPEISLAGGEEGGGITIEEAEGGLRDPVSAEGMIELIKSTVDPQSWDESLGYIEVRNNTLTVRTIPENHAKIDEMFTRIRKDAYRMVEVVTRVYRGPRDQVVALEGKMEGLTLSAEGEAALASLELLDTVKSIGFSTQRVVGTSLKQQAYIRDLTSVVNVSIGMYDPDIGYVQFGTSTDVRAVPSAEGDKVLLELRTTYSHLRELQTKNLSDETHTVTKDDKGTQTTVDGKTHRVIEAPQVDVIDSRGTYRVPKDKWVPVGSGSEKGDGQNQYLILVRARVIDN